MCFNPRTPGGVRHVDSDVFIQSKSFNPRTPGWVRLCMGIWHDEAGGFNPRTPGGVRLYKKERAESQGNMWYVLRTYWCGFPLNKLSDFSFKLSS